LWLRRRWGRWCRCSTNITAVTPRRRNSHLAAQQCLHKGGLGLALATEGGAFEGKHGGNDGISVTQQQLPVQRRRKTTNISAQRDGGRRYL